MPKVKINHEYQILKIGIKKEEELFLLSAGVRLFDIKSVVKELKIKKFSVNEKKITENPRNKREDIFKENIEDSIIEERSRVINFDEMKLIKFLSTDGNFDEEWHTEEEIIQVINPKNIIIINSNKYLNIKVKDPYQYISEIKEKLLENFNYAKKYKNYKEFLKFVKEALKNGFEIIEDEEFPGTMLKFYKDNQLVKSVYIKNEEIKFLDSFADEYKKLKIDSIKETLEDLNKQLTLENKEKIGLEFKEDG